MEPNFIEEVAKALDVLSVERLVRASLPGKVRCRECNKLLFTAIQARYTIIRAVEKNDHFEAYLCPVHEGRLYHLSSLDKQSVKMAGNPWLRRKIEQEKARLDEFRLRKNDPSAACQDALGKENLVVVDGRTSSVVPYTKALRRKIVRALVVPLQGMRKPRTHRFRKRRKPFRPTPRRDTARGDLPRGETMTKMLSWANGEKFHVDPHHSCRPRGGGVEFRRRNRAREAEAVRKLIDSEGTPSHVFDWQEMRYEQRHFDMNDEYTAPSNEVWRALAENDEGLRFVDFEGKYTCE